MSASDELGRTSWLVILPFSLFMLCMAWAVFSRSELGKRSWEVPQPADLTTFTGTFEATPAYHRSPYVVRRPDGEALTLRCTPGSRVVMCLENAGVTRASLAGKIVTVRYFTAPGPHFTIPGRSFGRTAILSSLSADGREVLGLETSTRELRCDARLEDQRREEGDPLALLIILGMVLAPAYAIYCKLRASTA